MAQESDTRDHWRPAMALVITVLLGGAVSGCGGTEQGARPGVSAPAVGPTVPTSSEGQVATSRPTPTTTRPAPATINVTLPPTTAPAGGEGDNVFGGDDAEDQRMPDVVCMDLQDAQNEIQDHGVFFSRSEDATGEGRRQILDRNWIVVDQEPEAGASIGEFEAVLYVVKDDEDHGC